MVEPMVAKLDLSLRNVRHSHQQGNAPRGMSGWCGSKHFVVGPIRIGEIAAACVTAMGSASPTP